MIRWFHDFTVAHLKRKILLHVDCREQRFVGHTRENHATLEATKGERKHNRSRRQLARCELPHIGDSSLFLRFMHQVRSVRDRQYFIVQLKSEETKKQMKAAQATAAVFYCGAMRYDLRRLRGCHQGTFVSSLSSFREGSVLLFLLARHRTSLKEQKMW